MANKFQLFGSGSKQQRLQTFAKLQLMSVVFCSNALTGTEGLQQKLGHSATTFQKLVCIMDFAEKSEKYRVIPRYDGGTVGRWTNKNHLLQPKWSETKLPSLSSSPVLEYQTNCCTICNCVLFGMLKNMPFLCVKMWLKNHCWLSFSERFSSDACQGVVSNHVKLMRLFDLGVKLHRLPKLTPKEGIRHL